MVCQAPHGTRVIRATPSVRAAAERLLKVEATVGKRGAATRPAAVRVIERLRQVLSTILGVAGFRALLGRAVTLAKAEVPALRAVVLEPDGSLTGMSEETLGTDQLADGEVVLVAHILGLLVTFVGVALMLRLVNDAWPKALLDDIDFDE